MLRYKCLKPMKLVLNALQSFLIGIGNTSYVEDNEGRKTRKV